MERGQVYLQGKEQAWEEAGVPWGLGLAPGELAGASELLQSGEAGGERACEVGRLAFLSSYSLQAGLSFE